MSGAYRAAFAAALVFALPGCSAIYDDSVDPGLTVPVESVLKSIRCELTTFFEVNRLRTQIFESNIGRIDFQSNFANYVYMDLDPTHYGTIDATFKTVDSLGLTLGADWVYKKGSISRDWHLGPSFAGTKTYNREVLMAVPQDARLGPDTRQPDGSVPPVESAPFGNPHAQDRDFFCYLHSDDTPLPRFSTKTIGDATDALALMEALTRHQLPQFENFRRIFIADLNMTLAEWLETIGAEMAKGFFSAGRYPYTGAVIPGQTNYTFGLEIKPGIDFKLTYIATIINPLIADANLSRDNTGTFELFLNMTHAAAAFGGKQGTAAIETPPKSVAWGPVAGPSKNRTVSGPGLKELSAPHRVIRPAQQSTFGTRSPGFRLEAPLPLPLPPPPGQ